MRAGRCVIQRIFCHCRQNIPAKPQRLSYNLSGDLLPFAGQALVACYLPIIKMKFVSVQIRQVIWRINKRFQAQRQAGRRLCLTRF